MGLESFKNNIVSHPPCISYENPQGENNYLKQDVASKMQSQDTSLTYSVETTYLVGLLRYLRVALNTSILGNMTSKNLKAVFCRLFSN